jgi:serine/threonine-protein phosphatase 4 regulatory subunit 2
LLYPQRLCELLTQPKRHYKRVDKLMRGLEKVMLVVSTVEPLARGAGGQETAGRGAAAVEGDAEEGEPALAMESPSKRIRLSSAEDEAGPCDSQDGAGQVSAAWQWLLNRR